MTTNLDKFLKIIALWKAVLIISELLTIRGNLNFDLDLRLHVEDFQAALCFEPVAPGLYDM